MSLEVEIRWRKDKAIEDEKRRLASMADGWIFGDNWLETHAIESISTKDYRQAYYKYQERREKIAEEDATRNAEISARDMISQGLLNNEKILKNLATCGDERLIHAITEILVHDGPAGCHEKWTAACEGRMISSI